MLIVFSGLPAVGKTTISRLLAEKIGAFYLRIDSIEQALITSGEIKQTEMGGAGYFVAYAIVRDNLRLGQKVIADCVNPIAITRMAWQQVAIETLTPILNIEVVCSDQLEHRKRVETRHSDIENFKLSTWNEILNREYEPFIQADLRLDTAVLSAEQAVNVILNKIYSLLK